MSIPETPEIGKGEAGYASGGAGRRGSVTNLAFFLLLIVGVAVGSYGLGTLSKIRKERPPVTIEYPAAATPSATPSATASTAPRTKGAYVAARGGTSYYLPWCAAAQRIAEKNRIWFETKEEAERLGYKPAKNCK